MQAASNSDAVPGVCKGSACSDCDALLKWLLEGLHEALLEALSDRE